MRNSATIDVWPQRPLTLVAAICAFLLLFGCATPTHLEVSSAPDTSMVPSQIGGRGRPLPDPSTYATAAAGPCVVGLFVPGGTVRSIAETITVSTWVSSDATQTRFLVGSTPWSVVAVTVQNPSGKVVFLESFANRPRGGGPVIVQVGGPHGGQVFQNTTTFRVDEPGRYRIYGSAHFQIGRSGLFPNELVKAGDLQPVSAGTPPVDLLIK